MSFRVRLLQASAVLAIGALLVVAALRQNRIAAPPARNVSSANGNVNDVPQAPQTNSENGTKQHLTVSPSGHRAVYHSPFNPYKTSPEQPVFTVVDAATSTALLRIPVDWSARYVSSVQWIDDRFVLAQGEGAFLAILDVKSGKQTHSLVGLDFSLSPNQAKIVFRYDFNPLRGYVPPEHQSNYVLFTLLRRTPHSGSVTTNYKVIYPNSLGWGESQPGIYSNLDERHQIRSNLVWSPDSDFVAFVERNQQKLWLVVLKLEVLNDDVNINPKIVDLGMTSESHFAISFHGSTEVRISYNENSSLMVDLNSGIVSSSP